MPQPKVDSTVIRLNIKEELPKVNRKIFFQVVKTAFSKRRKTLLNSLSSNPWGLDKEQIKEVLKTANIPLEIRAENLKIEDFVKISKTLPSLDIY